MRRDGIEAMTPAERICYCVVSLDKAVTGGGFGLFFINAGGDLAFETVRALGAIGADRVAQLLARAMDAFPEGGPSPCSVDRQNAMRRLGDEAFMQWDFLDREYESLHQSLLGQLRSYVEKNAAEFRPWSESPAPIR